MGHSKLRAGDAALLYAVNLAGPSNRHMDTAGIAPSGSPRQFHEMKTAVFVYGTLKRGQRNHGLLSDHQFLGLALTLPHYRLYDSGRHPALVDDPENGVAVRGEVWQVSEETLQKLDEYEGVP